MKKIVYKYLFLTLISIFFSYISLIIILEPFTERQRVQQYRDDIEKDIKTLQNLYINEFPSGEDSFSDFEDAISFLSANSLKVVTAVERSVSPEADQKNDSSRLKLPLEKRDGSLIEYTITILSLSEYIDFHYHKVDFMEITIAYILIMAPFLLAATYFLSKNVFSESQYLGDIMQRISEGDRDISIRPMNHTPELSDITSATVRMQERLKSVDDSRLRQTQELTHDLKGPIAGLFAQIESIELGAMVLDSHRFDSIYKELHTINRMVERMTYLYRLKDSTRNIEKEELDISSDLLTPLLTRYEAIAESRGIRIHCTNTADTIKGNRDLLIRGIGNLIQNALTHGTGKEIFISINEIEGLFHFRVSNEGNLTRDELPSLFLRYHQKEPTSKGEGLGLSITQTIAEIHGGALRADIDENGLISFTLIAGQDGKQG